MLAETDANFRLTEMLTDLKQIIHSPRTYLTTHFDNLRALIDSECEKYIQIQTEAYERSKHNPDPLMPFSKEDLESDINQTHQFKFNLHEELEKFKLECLTRVNAEFRFNQEMTEMATKLLEECETIEKSSEEADRVVELTERVYELGLTLQAEVFGNKCFLVVTQDKLDPDLPFCCLLCISDDFIGREGENNLK